MTGTQRIDALISTGRLRECPTCFQRFAHGGFCPFDGDPLSPVASGATVEDPLIGEVIDGRYRVEELIGEGGMGSVYTVRHVSLDRLFAMKLLKRNVVGDPEQGKRFIQEAQAAAAIGHPHIVGVTDIGTVAVGAGSIPFFVMELLVGETLADRLAREGRAPLTEVVRIGRECASALEQAHLAGVIHRDLKPENVFLCTTPRPDFTKIVDFGIAKLKGAGKLTQTGSVVGTPYYMSPEQASGASVDERSDIYSLGVVLYQMASGRLPFDADSYLEILTLHMIGEPPPLLELTRCGADGLRLVIERCLTKEPTERFASMAELGVALANLEVAELSSPSKSSGTRGRFPGPLPWALGALLGAGVTFLALSGGSVPASARRLPRLSVVVRQPDRVDAAAAPKPASSGEEGLLPASRAGAADLRSSAARVSPRETPAPVGSIQNASKARRAGAPEVLDPWNE